MWGWEVEVGGGVCGVSEGLEDTDGASCSMGLLDLRIFGCLLKLPKP